MARSHRPGGFQHRTTTMTFLEDKTSLEFCSDEPQFQAKNHPFCRPSYRTRLKSLAIIIKWIRCKWCCYRKLTRFARLTDNSTTTLLTLLFLLSLVNVITTLVVLQLLHLLSSACVAGSTSERYYTDCVL